MGGWPLEQTRRWEQEQEASKAEAAAMEEERVNKAVKEFQKDPEAVSKKTEEAIGHQKDGSGAKSQTGGGAGGAGSGSGLPTGKPGG